MTGLLIQSRRLISVCDKIDWFGETDNPDISEITTANNSKMKVVCVGDINISVQREDTAQTVLVRNVLCVPDLTANLHSVSRIVE